MAKETLGPIIKTDSIKPLAIAIIEGGMHYVEAIGDSGEPIKLDYADAFINELGKHFRVAPPVRSGSELWSLLFDEIPRIVIISRTLKDIDAVSLIRTLRSSKYGFKIRFFLCCREVNNSVKSICSFNEIDGAFSYTASIEETVDMIREKYVQFAQNQNRLDMQRLRDLIDDTIYFSDPSRDRAISSDVENRLLVPFGLDPEHKGTHYLKLLISMRVCGMDWDLKSMYSCVGEYFKTSGAAVEKAIRYAIEQAWKKGRPYIQFRFFGNSVDAERGKPTNAEFIAITARHISDRLTRGIEIDD